MTSAFENIQVDIETLPSVNDVAFLPLQKNHLKVSAIGNSIFWFILLFPFSTLLIMNPMAFPAWAKILAIVLFFLIVGLSFLLIKLGFKKKGYALRDKDIVYKTGLIWKSQTTVPFSRIQHCEVKEGPIERAFDLASLHVYTAGGTASDLSIPGLMPDKAAQLKQFVLQKIREEDPDNPSLNREEE